MPEPVTCHSSTPNASIIDCDDITISSQPPVLPQQCQAPDPGTSAGGGAGALVRSYTPPLAVKEMPLSSPQIDTPVGEIAEECAPKVIGVGLAAATTTVNPVIGFALGFKAGWDLAECIYDTTQDAQRRSDVAYTAADCRAEGGIPLGIVGDNLTCLLPASERVQ